MFQSTLPTLNSPGFFNLTSTFRTDSDFPIQYLRLIKKKRTSKQSNFSHILQPKKKLMAWFVSHCKTESRREDYAEELKKYIPIDIFGGCGNKTACQRNKPRKRKQCTNVQLPEYKFYFAAENSLCKDYHTGGLTDRGGGGGHHKPQCVCPTGLQTTHALSVETMTNSFSSFALKCFQ